MDFLTKHNKKIKRKVFEQDEVKREIHYYKYGEENILHGEYKEWYKSGGLYRHCFYRHGQRHGECKQWFPNGNISFHAFFHATRFSERKFNEGELIGEAKVYDLNGIVNHKFHFNPENIKNSKLEFLKLGFTNKHDVKQLIHWISNFNFIDPKECRNQNIKLVRFQTLEI